MIAGHSLNIRHLAVFREVALARGVSAAAGQAHLSQPAITQAVSKLETGLGVALFDRKPNGMFLTGPGQMLFDRVNRALDHLANGSRDAARLGKSAGAAPPRRFDHLLTTAQLRALVALSESANFSMAARNIGISQPSIHRAARTLESVSGLRLFNASPEGVSLTQAAQVFATRVQLAFAELRQGLDEIAAGKGLDSTVISIGTLPLARTSILPRAISRLVSETGGVQVRVIDGPYEEHLRALRTGKIDFIIGALRYPPPVDDVEQERLFDDPLAIVAGHNHPLAKRGNVTIEETLQYPWVAPPRATPAGTYLYETLKIADRPDTPVRVVSSSLVLLRSLLTLSHFITIISLHQIRHEHQQGLLVPLPVRLKNNRRDIGFTFRGGWKPTPTQRRFLDLIREIEPIE